MADVGSPVRMFGNGPRLMVSLTHRRSPGTPYRHVNLTWPYGSAVDADNISCVRNDHEPSSRSAGNRVGEISAPHVSFTIRLVCVFRPARIARTMGSENK